MSSMSSMNNEYQKSDNDCEMCDELEELILDNDPIECLYCEKIGDDIQDFHMCQVYDF